MKKKGFLFLLSIVAAMTFMSAIFSVSASSAQTLSTVDIEFQIKSAEVNLPSEANLTLFDGNKKYYATVIIGSSVDSAIAHFDVDPFSPGKDFKLTIESGFSSVIYYDYKFEKGSEIGLWTYTDVNTSLPVSVFHMSAVAEKTKPVQYYADFNFYPLTVPAQYHDGVLYVPAAEGARAMGVPYIVYVPETGEITYYIFDDKITMYLGSTSATAYGYGYTLDAPPVILNEYPYIPLLSFAEIVDADVILQNEPDHVNAVVSTSKVALKNGAKYANEQRMNSSGISSSTNYMIWVNKSEYKLRVFTGSKNNWNQIAEFTCAIGKDSTPTCTGVYKYYSKEKMWAYSSYYVGPIMRFNGGYAIHSTLLRYNGTPYDNRVGMKLSHGCVRLRAQDINWLVNTIPLYSTIYITNS